MKEVIKGEVLKLLDAGIIYLITDSKWVSPTQAIAKESGVTILWNKSEEMFQLEQLHAGECALTIGS